MAPKPTPKQTSKLSEEVSDAYNIHQADNPYNVDKVISIQTRFYKQDLHWRILGVCGFVIFILLPYYLAKKYIDSVINIFPDKYMFISAALSLVSLLSFTLANLMYVCFYKLEHPFFEQYKDNDQDWPWNTDPNFREKLNHAIKKVAVNKVFLGGGFVFIVFVLLKFPLRISSEDFPSLTSYVTQILFMVFTEDIAFYFCHRTFHTPWLYKKVHKVHHEFYDSFSLCSEYAHPVEFLCGNVFPLFLGTLLLCGKAHIITLVVFVAFRLVETVESHGGYDFPWSVTKYLPLSCTSKYHNYHHLKNIGNFGSMFILWDSIFGTNSHYYKDMNSKGDNPKVTKMTGSKKED